MRFTIICAAFLLAGCNTFTDRAIDSYFDRHGEEQLERILGEISHRQLEKAREKSDSIEYMLSQKVDAEALMALTKKAAVKGTAGAPLQIIELTYGSCVFCKTVYGKLSETLEKNYSGKYEWKSAAFRNNLNDESLEAAQWLWVAQKMGKYWPLRDALQKDTKIGFNKALALKTLGISESQVKKEIASKDCKDDFEVQKDLGDTQHLLSSPILLINGSVFTGSIVEGRLEKTFDFILNHAP